VRRPYPVHRSVAVAAPSALIMSMVAGIPAHSAITVPPGPVAPHVRSIPIELSMAESADAQVDDGTAVTDELRLEGASLVGVTWSSAAHPPAVLARARTGSTWGTWIRLDADAVHGPDPNSTEAAAVRPGTEPLIVGDAESVQIRVEDAARVRGLRLELVDPMNSGAAAGDNAEEGGAAELTAAVPQPTIHTRAEWGADESLRDDPPRYGSTIYAGWVHHTVDANDYSSAEVPGIIRSIYAYHVISRGWSDIGYNFLVDRFGRLWEGRYGGIDKPVIGAHTLGFNTNTFAVSAIGNFEQVSPPGTVNESIAALMAWKLGLYGRDPDGSTQALDGTWRPVIGGHRDAASTACPGQYLYDRLPTIRARAADVMFAGQIGGDAATPVGGDIDGDGRADLGWYHDGRWAFLLAGGTVTRFSFGRAGDAPVVGDFDRDGRDEPGVFRGGSWHLRSSASSGAAWRVFRYGQAGDVPVVGRWPGSSSVGLAVVRGNTWHLRYGLGGGQAQWSFSFGRAGDVPVAGDWLGDGSSRPGVVRAGQWYLSTSIIHPSTRWTFRFGWPEDAPLVIDYEGDRVETAAVVRRVEWYLRRDHSNVERTTVRHFAG
jgi:N-acetylmuramoyl-L-alanine amidase